MVGKTTYVRTLEDEQIKEIKEELKTVLEDEDIDIALDGRLSDLEDTIDIYSLKKTKVK